LQTVSIRQTLIRLISSGTTTSARPTFFPTSSYQTSISTRRFSARPSAVAFEAIGWLSPAHSKEIDSGGRPRAAWRNSAASPTRDPGEGARQRLVVGVPHQVEPHVLQVLHAAQDAPEPLHGAGRNLRDAGRVSDRRNHAGELGDLDVVRDHLPLLQPVAEFGVE
jgi:hypothetical protein